MNRTTPPHHDTTPSLHPSATLIERLARYLIIALSAYACINYIRIGDRVSLASAGLTILLLLLPSIVVKLSPLRLPVSVRGVYLLFILCAMYLGEIHSFFYRFLWWDDMLHSASAMMVSYIGLILIFVLNKDKNMDQKLAPGFVALFVFCFTMAFGALWELFEFSCDQLLGVNMLKGRDSTLAGSVYSFERALVNTMQDFSLDAFGALGIALLAYYHIWKKKLTASAFGIFLRQLVEENPRWVE
ncbi:MAG TPA: hypothetical protein P5533_05665 [Candidatus Cloacimonadota bacterium]|nr:hypothetical protein [Candidatus Cloacimonadota bacterium]